MAPIINLIDNSDCTFLQNSKFTNSSSITPGLDIGYVPAGPDAFFRWSGQFGPQQLIFYWPARSVDFFFFFFFFFRITIPIWNFVRGWLLNNLIIGLCANSRFMQIVFHRASLVLR